MKLQIFYYWKNKTVFSMFLNYNEILFLAVCTFLNRIRYTYLSTKWALSNASEFSDFQTSDSPHIKHDFQLWQPCEMNLHLWPLCFSVDLYFFFKYLFQVDHSILYFILFCFFMVCILWTFFKSHFPNKKKRASLCLSLLHRHSISVHFCHIQVIAGFRNS